MGGHMNRVERESVVRKNAERIRGVVIGISGALALLLSIKLAGTESNAGQLSDALLQPQAIVNTPPTPDGTATPDGNYRVSVVKEDGTQAEIIVPVPAPSAPQTGERD